MTLEIDRLNGRADQFSVTDASFNSVHILAQNASAEQLDISISDDPVIGQDDIFSSTMTIDGQLQNFPNLGCSYIFGTGE